MKIIVELVEMLVLLANCVALVFAKPYKQMKLIVELADMLVLLATPVAMVFVKQY